ncbi:ADP-ribose pyrophosphatase [Gracilibacillus ureilyticus]|uniref:ADP-ribose pyrophosphatase n=1 Tax=Gracilibacillus ureilyticus TaxID=531814 RepID=A0A1H9R3I5_9BACI|nr:NUDIX hydrolase [Gracilibacillus ureilyticus]SER67260.1 ADP-ribose pyrophosphatase [Gracilibacillus ureilyticus]
MVNIPWKVTSTQTTQVDRFKITIDEIMVNNQAAKNFSYIQFRDGVCVLAITPDNHIVVLKQYRHAIQSWELELPGGMIDDGEEPLPAAKRELLEETGFHSLEWESLGHFYPSAGSTTEKIHLFLANNASYLKEQNLDHLESIQVEAIPIDTFYQRIADGDIKHGAGLACWAKYLSDKCDN